MFDSVRVTQKRDRRKWPVARQRIGRKVYWMWHAHLARDSRAGRPCHLL